MNSAEARAGGVRYLEGGKEAIGILNRLEDHGLRVMGNCELLDLRENAEMCGFRSMWEIEGMLVRKKGRGNWEKILSVDLDTLGEGALQYHGSEIQSFINAALGISATSLERTPMKIKLT